jgi:16S rRNA (cytidine1402-2'-O)-methyltransferase
MPSRTQSVGPLFAGTLFVVATPIGNLSDLTDRAREILSSVAVIAAEDTRHTGTLLKALGIATPLMSLHEHNEAQRCVQLLQRLQAGESVALVSDAGTPLISDPGFDVVRTVVASGVRVVPIPGACALIAALSVAGLPTDRFAFEGFLPTKDKQRLERLVALHRDPRTLIFYEAPHRLSSALGAIASAFGKTRRVVVARELTKQYETVYRGTAGELAVRAETDPDMTRGELVLIVEGGEEQSPATLESEHVLRILLAELPPAQAAKLAARLTDGKRDELYRRAIELNSET